MGSSYKSGFTLIETMLFLAITGALVVAVLIGTGASINIQRYHDSVTSLKSFIQKQYSDTINVQNELQPTDISCDSNANVGAPGATKPRGQSNCVVMGKHITIDQGTITTRTVIGHEGGAPIGSSEVDLMKSYNLSTLASSAETSQLEWGAQIAWPISGGGARNPTTPRPISILIIRSPQNGEIYTFTADDTNTPLKSMIVAGSGTVPGIYGQSQRTICVDSDGLFVGNNMAVSINAYATSASDVETRSNNLGFSSKC